MIMYLSIQRLPNEPSFGELWVQRKGSEEVYLESQKWGKILLAKLFKFQRQAEGRKSIIALSECIHVLDSFELNRVHYEKVLQWLRGERKEKNIQVF